jgi:predicted nucleic acid-binding protein
MYNKLYRLLAAIDQYELEVFVNDQLVNEIERNLTSSLQDKEIKPILIMDAIIAATINFETIAAFDQSPDSKDNFLFDLALQSNSEIIVTKEKALLNFKESPVAIRDIKWFKETYPVAL